MMSERERAMHVAVNALAVAKAVLQGMVDGVIDRSDEHLEDVLAAIGHASEFLTRAAEE